MAYTSIDLWDAQNPARPFASGVNTGQNTGATMGVYINGTYYPKDPRLDKERYKFTKEGGWTGDNPAWTIDSQGNIVRPAAQTGFGGTGIGYSDLGAGNTIGQNAFSNFNTPLAPDLVEPRMAYYGSGAGQAFGDMSPAKRRFFQNSFEQIYDEFLGYQKDQMSKGIPEDATFFTDYLETDPFTKRYGKLTPSERGESTARYSPKARHIYF